MALVEKTLTTASEVKKFLKGKEIITLIEGDEKIWLVLQASTLISAAGRRSIVINVSWMDNAPSYIFLDSIDKKPI